MKKLELLSQYGFFEKIQLVLMWMYDRLLGKHRKGIYELKQLIQNMGDAARFHKQGTNNLITFDDFKVLVRRTSSDVPVFSQVFYYKEYQAVIDTIREPSTIKYIVDAGANVGFTTLFFSKYFPDAKIISIEPEERNYAMMLKNFQLNACKAIALKQALWNKNENLEIDREFRDHREWAIAVKPAGAGKERVEGITLPELCKKYQMPRIDILKIDIEGAERFLFDTEEHVRQFLPMTRYLAMEIHDEYHIKDHILGLLKKFNFSYFPHGELIIGVNENLR